ncbi:813_t:CDS:10 [Rhizophagus irregularis]|nr:813_t:CDS:10 [Rhizophagus irregularis]
MRILLGNFLLIFAIILCSYTLYTTADIRVLSHNEQIDYGQTLPRIWDSKSYDDGTMVVRIVRKNVTTSINNYLCFHEMLSLRIINTDGTVVEKDLKLDIQPLNYCAFQMVSGGIWLEYMKYVLIRKNQIFIAYYDATDINNPSTYVEWGMVIDYDGNVLSRTNIGLPFVNNTLQIIIPNDQFVLNINREKGFMRYGTGQNNNIEWQQFRVEPDGSITKLTFGELANEGQLFILPIAYGQNPGNPLLLYQTPVPNLVFVSLICDIAFSGVGQVCTLTALQSNPTGNLPPNTFYIKINFLSSGSVTSFRVINRILPVENVNVVWAVNSLAFGGYLLTNTVTAPTGPSMYGYLFDEDNTDPINWEFPEPQPIGIKGVYQILPNNTLLVSQVENSNSWQFQVIDLPKFDGNRDNGYFNLNVESTVPAIKTTINPNIQNITINFYDPVELSNGLLSIYQLIDNKPYLRQSISQSSCKLENGGKTVNANILGSTFSVSNGNYFIKMDNGFVVDKSYKEPLLGIRDNVWNFNIEPKKDPFAPSTTGLLRLSPEGTSYFDSLSQEQQTNFFNTLLNDLSNAVPVPRPRLTSNEKTQLDLTVNEKQYLISIGIKETNDENDLSVVTVVNNINTMVKNKAQTPIGSGMATRYLDQVYGFNPSPNLWEKYKYRLLGVFLIIGLLIVLFLFAQRRDSNGNNIAILQLGLIIFDLVLDVAFVSSNARDVPVLYIPSVVFVTLPIGLNTILAFYIITQENTRPKFFQWFTAHGKVASILYRKFTVSYDNIIPLLTLISSAVNLTINIIGRLYQATNRLRHSNGSQGSNDDDTDDFGGLVAASSDASSNKKDLERLEEGENVSREIGNPESSQNYLGDVLKLDKNDEKLGLDAVLNKSYNASNGNLGNDQNKNKGMTFLKRMKMELSTLLFTLISVVIVYIIFNQRKKSQFPNKCISLPGPKPLPIIGNLHQIKDVPMQNFIDRFSKEYGPIFKVHYGAETWIILNDYEIIRDLLVKRGAIYSSRPYNEAITGIYTSGGKSIGFSPYGKYWRAMRAVAHQALTQKVVDNNYRNIIQTEVKDLMIKLFNHSSKVFDPTDDMRSSLIDLLATISYGQKSEKLSQQIKQMFVGFAQVLNPGNSYFEMFPWIKYIPFIDKILYSYAYKAKYLLDDMSKQLLEDLRQRLKENDGEENSFAAHVLKNMNISTDIATKPYEDSLENDDDDSKKNFVFDEVDFMGLNNAFLVAGTGTTVAALRWIWALLVNHPEVQRKIQKELDECLQGNRFPTPEDDSNLPYLLATIKESFRFRPALNLLLKHSTTKDDIYRGYYIPEKSVIIASFKSAHTSEKLFERPNEFYPEHYLDENGKLKKYDELRDPWAFGRGRRMCVGLHLAERNLITTVGYVLTLFNIENDVDPITQKPIKLDLNYVENKFPKPYKLRFVPRPGVTIEKIMQMK